MYSSDEFLPLTTHNGGSYQKVSSSHYEIKDKKDVQGKPIGRTLPNEAKPEDYDRTYAIARPRGSPK